MHICIPIKFYPHGGGFYFLQLFEKYLTEIGWQITREIKGKYDVLFTNHWMTPVDQIVKAICFNPRIRVVQRIDGVAQDYGRDTESDRNQAEVNQWADLTIFQSRYSRFVSREKYRVIGQLGPIIYNPVDLEQFTPHGPKRALDGKYRVVCVSWSSNPLKGSAQIFAVARNNPHISFVLCGNFINIPDLANLHKLGVLDRDDLASVYRSCQLLLTFSKNEACPNHVIEALASGLPVLFEDSGAMSEVIGDCGAPVTIENFPYQFDEILRLLPDLSTKARERAIQRHHPKQIFPEYIEAIQDALSKPTQIPISKRFLAAWAQRFRTRFAHA